MSSSIKVLFLDTTDLLTAVTVHRMNGNEVVIPAGSPSYSVPFSQQEELDSFLRELSYLIQVGKIKVLAPVNNVKEKEITVTNNKTSIAKNTKKNSKR